MVTRGGGEEINWPVESSKPARQMQFAHWLCIYNAEWLTRRLTDSCYWQAMMNEIRQWYVKTVN